MKKIILFYLLVGLGMLLYSFGSATYENVKVNMEIKRFIESGIEVKRDVDNKLIYYEVENEDSSNEYNAFYDIEQQKLGQPGDILIASGSTYPEVKVVDSIIGYYFGKHAALVLSDGKLAEAMIGYADTEEVINYGLWSRDEENPTRTGITISSNYFLSSKSYSPNTVEYEHYGGFYSKEMFGVRVKGLTDEDRQAVSDFGMEIYDENPIYNFFFFINNHNGYYCTSFVREAYSRLNSHNGDRKFNIDYDGFTITQNDIILARDTYLFSYFYVDDEGMGNIYYLKGDKKWT